MSHPGLRTSTSDISLLIRDLLEWSRRVMAGKLNNTSLWTMDANQGSTTFTDDRIGFETAITFSPTTANAAADLANTFVAEGSRINGSVTVTHSNNAQTDKTFRVTLNG